MPKVSDTIKRCLTPLNCQTPSVPTIYPETMHNQLQEYNNKGCALYKQKLWQQAIPYFEAVLSSDDTFWEAHYNLAHCFAQINNNPAALKHYQATIQCLEPRFSPLPAITNVNEKIANAKQVLHNAHFNIACLFYENRKYNEAVFHFEKCLLLDKLQSKTFELLAECTVGLGKTIDAIQAFLQALALNPNLAQVHHNLGILYLDQDKEQALFHFQSSLEINPENNTAQHMVHALSGKTHNQAQENYVKELFDQYAGYYNTHMQTTLNYNLPAQLREEIGKIYPFPFQFTRVLDLGCGTGLCGVYFRDLAFELLGLDISEKMIEEAKKLGAYDKLFTVDLLKFCAEQAFPTGNIAPALADLYAYTFHIVLAAEVLVYCGDLERIFQGLQKILEPGGFFIFSTEITENENYVLQPSGRFAHHKKYIENLAQKYYFNVEGVKKMILRKHEHTPIFGNLFLLKKSVL